LQNNFAGFSPSYVAKLAAARKLDADASGYYSTVAPGVDAVFDMTDRMTASLNGLLHARVAKFQREVLQTLGGAALGLLAVSLVISASLAALSSWSGTGTVLIGEAINFVGSLAILTALFGMLFKWSPDTEIAWSDVFPGAVATAFLFNAGKFAIGWYIGTQGLESTYGAAASIVVLLVWVHYSAQIVLFGAELTHAYAAEGGSRQTTSVNESTPQLILIATGSEVPLALEARLALQQEGIRTRVVSMPCCELFAEQSDDYRSEVLPPNVSARLAIEAGVRQGWDRYVGLKGDVICLDRFGASAPVADVMRELGFNVENVLARARVLI
jgi:hypothetical protein